jgi:drug/metabolite transporter (DMT)-like permease
MRFVIAGAAGGVLLTPALVAWGGRLAAFPAAVWALLAATAVAQTAYYVALARAYRAGDFSVAYPLTRALPLALAAAWGWLGTDAPTRLAPLALLIIGCLILPLRSFSERWRARVADPATPWILLTALAITAYAIIDDRCMRLLATDSGGGLSDALVFCALETWATTAALLAWLALRGGWREPLAQAWRDRASAIPVGCAIAVSYALALAAMPQLPHVGWSLALRQASIPIGALAGMIWLGEAPTRPKLAGLALITAGLAWTAC